MYLTARITPIKFSLHLDCEYDTDLANKFPTLLAGKFWQPNSFRIFIHGGEIIRTIPKVSPRLHVISCSKPLIWIRCKLTRRQVKPDSISATFWLVALLGAFRINQRSLGKWRSCFIGIRFFFFSHAVFFLLLRFSGRLANRGRLRARGEI